MQLQLVRQRRRRSKCEKQLLKLKAESRSWLNCCAAFWSFIFTKLVHYELVLIRLAVVLCSGLPCSSSWQSPQPAAVTAAEMPAAVAKTFQLKQSSQSRTVARHRVCRIFGRKTEQSRKQKTKQNRSWQSAAGLDSMDIRAGNNKICLLTSWLQ